jgi:putative membrane protein
MAFVGVVLLSARQPLVAHYAERAGDDAALADQRRAASLMWVAGMGTTLPLLLLAVWRWATTEQRVAERTEELADRRGDERHPPPHRTATH